MWPSNTTRKRCSKKHLQKKKKNHRRHCPESIVPRVPRWNTSQPHIESNISGAIPLHESWSSYSRTTGENEPDATCFLSLSLFYFRFSSSRNFDFKRKLKKGYDPITTYIESENLCVRLFFVPLLLWYFSFVVM